jgi:NAD(P)-dependent dehydrogenase (short-subunit alcohol dehydrogenase family)
MLNDLTGKVALVSGAASGIGRALAEVLGKAGMQVVATDIDDTALAETRKSLDQAGVTHLCAAMDIRDRAAWASVVQQAERTLGPIQLLCNNAGVTLAPTPVLDTSEQAWNWVIGTNLNGAFNGVSVVAGRMRELKLPGHLVNTASIQGMLAAANFSAYNAAKFAIVGFSETLRVELDAFDIGVSVLCPGATRGNMMLTSRKLAPQWFPPNIERPRIGFTNYQTPDQVAEKTLDAIRHNRFYIITHPEYRPLLEARWKALDMSMTRTPDPTAVENVLSVERPILESYQSIARNAS